MEFASFVKERLLEESLTDPPPPELAALPSVKIALYGPAFAGKTSFLKLLQDVWAGSKTSLKSVAPRGAGLTAASPDQDWQESGLISYFDAALADDEYRIRVASSGGQVWREAARRELVRFADAILFVFDAQVERAEAGQEAWENLQADLLTLEAAAPPLVLALNKVDLAPRLSLDQVRALLAPPASLLMLETCVVSGAGAVEAFKQTVSLALSRS